MVASAPTLPIKPVQTFDEPLHDLARGRSRKPFHLRFRLRVLSSNCQPAGAGKVASFFVGAAAIVAVAGGPGTAGLLAVELGVEVPGMGQQLVLGRMVGVDDDRADDLFGHVGVVVPQVG